MTKKTNNKMDFATSLIIHKHNIQQNAMLRVEEAEEKLGVDLPFKTCLFQISKWISACLIVTLVVYEY